MCSSFSSWPGLNSHFACCWLSISVPHKQCCGSATGIKMLLFQQKKHFNFSSPTDKPWCLQQTKTVSHGWKNQSGSGQTKAIWRAEDKSFWGLLTPYSPGLHISNPYTTEPQCICTQHAVNEDTRIALQSPFKSQNQVVI